MKCIATGVLEKSRLFFSTPSGFAESNYYNAISSGHFYCDKNYHLVRDGFESFLILYVISGSFTFVNGEGRHIVAKKDDTVFLDCYSKHEYYSTGDLETVWVHIRGADSLKFYKEIIKNNGNIICCKNTEQVKASIMRIVDSMGNSADYSEVEISLEIYKLFLQLLNPVSFKMTASQQKDEGIEAAKNYIISHIKDDIKVSTLANISRMSTSHFSRVFKSQTGFSPYDYVLMVRLNRAKVLLQNTDMTISQIAEEVGFNSEANFVYFFTNNERISPGKFRKLNF